MNSVVHDAFSYYTVVAVSHHLEMVMSFDCILVMHDGEMVKDGKSLELVMDTETRFGKLHL